MSHFAQLYDSAKIPWPDSFILSKRPAGDIVTRRHKRAFHRQRDMKRTPLPLFAFHCNPASMRINDIFYNLCPESGPADFATDRLVGEEAFPDFEGHALPCINDREDDAVPTVLYATLNGD